MRGRECGCSGEEGGVVGVEKGRRQWIWRMGGRRRMGGGVNRGNQDGSREEGGQVDLYRH